MRMRMATMVMFDDDNDDDDDNEAHVQNITSSVSTLRQLDRNYIIIEIEDYMYSVSLE